MPVPFHASSEFLVMPMRWRKEFLKRNPTFRRLLDRVLQAQRAGRLLYDLLGDRLASPQAYEIWRWRYYESPALQARAALPELSASFYAAPMQYHIFDDTFGPPGHIALMPGPYDFESFGELRWGLEMWGFPEVSLGRFVTPEIAAMRDGPEQYDAAMAAVQREMGKWVDEVLPTSDAEACWDELNVRQQRQLHSRLSSLRKRLGFVTRRKVNDDKYKKMLAVWDTREGWTGEGYDSREVKPLKRATLTAESANHEQYYRAFKLIVGEDYSDEMWEVHFGRDWRDVAGSDFRGFRESTTRRRVGRKQGSTAPGPLQEERSTQHQPGPAAPVDPSTLVSEGEAVQKFVELVSQGVKLPVAVEKAGLRHGVARKLLGATGDDKALVDEFVRQTRAG